MYSSGIHDLHSPALDDVVKILQGSLSECFTEVSCGVVDCPDLTKPPFNLAAQGICGSPLIADVGGFGHLLPLAQKDKKYDLMKVIEDAHMPNGWLIGAGAAPFYTVGVNGEITADLKCENDKPTTNGTYIAIVDSQTKACVMKQYDTTGFALLGQFLLSEGQPGKVIEVRASHRIKPGSLVTFIRQAITDQYSSCAQPVGLGGVILQETGKAKTHVMPEFSECPLDTDAKVNDWLVFHESQAPLVCVGEVVSHDPSNLALRLEHFHCFTDDRKGGGHYHYDLTPDEVVFRAYLIVGNKLLRMDQPKPKN